MPSKQLPVFSRLALAMPSLGYLPQAAHDRASQWLTSRPPSAFALASKLALLCLLLTEVRPALSQTLDPFYRGPYTVRALGAVPGLPGLYGGLTFKAGDTNTLLIGGDANADIAKIYSIGVVRGTNGHLTGFTGNATPFSDANGLTNGGGIDGGLIYGPSNVLFYTSYNDNSISEIKPGSTRADKQVALDALGVAGSVGGLIFVPPGFPGAGRMKILSFGTALWYDTTVSPDGSGTYNIANPATGIQLSGGLEGAFYVAAGNPRFPRASVLVAEYATDSISTYEIDANGDPVPATGKLFINGLTGATGGTVDPATGDFLFTGLHSANVYVVGGFGATPPSVTLTAPTDGTSLAAPATFLLTAIASQTNGLISQVQFFAGTNSLGIDTSAPYNLTVNGIAAGSYALTAVATDGSGNSATSSVVNISVTNIPPQISLATPTDSASFPLCSSIALMANVVPGSGAITDVAFYNGTVQLADVTTPPYRFTVTNALESGYAFSVLVRDNAGQSVTSAVARVTIVTPPLHTLIGGFTAPGKLGFCFSGKTGTNYVFEATTNLLPPVVWLPLQTNRIVGRGVATIFADPNASGIRQRFYRARSVP